MTWARSNLAYPMHTFVIDDQGKTLWACAPNGKGQQIGLNAAIGNDLPTLLARLPKTFLQAARLKTAISFVGKFRGRPAVISGMAIVPWFGTGQIELPRYLVFVRELDHEVDTIAAALDDITRQAASNRELGLTVRAYVKQLNDRFADLAGRLEKVA
jgi:sensor domain CHASE-containing protein